MLCIDLQDSFEHCVWLWGPTLVPLPSLAFPEDIYSSPANQWTTAALRKGVQPCRLPSLGDFCSSLSSPLFLCAPVTPLTSWERLVSLQVQSRG